MVKKFQHSEGEEWTRVTWKMKELVYRIVPEGLTSRDVKKRIRRRGKGRLVSKR